MEIRSLDCIEVKYPIFGSNLFVPANYLEQVIIKIMQFSKKDTEITLIARGTSGAICSGYVLSGLYNQGYTNIKIILSRKHVTRHDYPFQTADGIVIFVDDIIETGETLASVIEEYGYIDYAFVSTKELTMDECISKRNYEIISKNVKVLYLG